MPQSTGRAGGPGDRTPPSGRLTRRRLLAVLGAGVVGTAGTAAADGGRERAAGSWPMFQYDRRNTGNAPREEGPRDAAGARWGYLEGGSFESTPIVTSDTVYAVDAGGGAVVAVDRETGSERWRVETDVGAARPSLRGDSLLVPADSLESRSLSDGSLEWTADVGSPDAVAVRGDFAYLTSGGGVTRVSLGDKQEDWFNDQVLRIHPGLAVQDDLVYAVGKQNAAVIALDSASGSRRWLRRIDGGATGAPTAGDSLVYVSTDAGLTAMSVESGVPEWSIDTPVGSSVAYDGDTVYATTPDGTVLALAASSGGQRWSADATTGSNPPVLAGGLLFLTGTDGSITAVNPGDGTVVWEATVGGGRAANVAVAGGELYAGDENGDLAAMAAGERGGLRTPTPSPTATPTPTETPAAGGDTPAATPTPTPTSSPGFGALAGAVGTGLAALVARRWRDDDDAE